jgi:RNA polymerase sigma-70 factor (ECF subfamily)
MIQGESLGQRAGIALDAQDDDALLVRLRAGDEVAFQALVDRHRPWLVRLCTRLLGHDVHAAEDAAQESLLKLHAAARRDGRPLRVRPWLTVVARNTCVDEQRRRRPDLPGELPERAAPGDDPFHLDAALGDAWPRLAGRHREVLYLREVLGFSYKEIGAVMGLSMPATETLVFRARAALRREYQRSGGSAFGGGLFGFHLARFGLRRRREVPVTDGMSNAVVTDPGLGGLSSRLAQFLSTSLPGCGEQAMAKVLAVAAGVVMAAASVLPGFGPFADTPPAAASVGPTVLSGQSGPDAAPLPFSAAAPSAGATKSVTLKSLLGEAVPTDWTPHQARTGVTPVPATEPSGAGAESRPRRVTPLRDAAAARPADGPALTRPVRRPSGTGPIRSMLPARPDTVDRSERPAHPLRSLLADPVPVPIDPVPADPMPADPISVIPLPDAVPEVEETVEPVPEVVPAVGEVSGSLPTTTFAEHEPDHL